MLKNIFVIGVVLFLVFAFLDSIFCFEFKGFGDTGYGYETKMIETMMMGKSKMQESAENKFILGSFTIYTAQQLTDNLDALLEIVAMPGTEESMAGLALARGQIRYSFSDFLAISAGKFHTPVGYYSGKIRHVRFFDPLIERPESLLFEMEGGFLPLHQVGLLAKGKVNIPSGTLDLSGMISNGQKIQISKTTKDGMEMKMGMLSPLNTSDDDKNKQVTISMTYSPDILGGFGIGISGYQTEVHAYDLSFSTKPVVLDNEQIVNAVHLYYTASPWELYSEYLIINNKEKEKNKSYSNSAYFIQVAYKFKDKFSPYFRYENLTIKPEDSYFAILGKADKTIISVGVKYDFTEFSSVKLELKNSEQKTGMTETKKNRLGLQWAFSF